MSIFLFLKPIVDMCFEARWLDYLMVLFALLLFGYQMVLIRPSVRDRLAFTDISFLLIGLLISITFLRDGEGYTAYFKIISAILMYFLGRIYYDRILECQGALVLSSYIVIWLNFAHRIFTYGFSMFMIKNAEGDFYYSDTDMAIAMLMGLIIIAFFGRNKWYKAVTIFLIAPYMILVSDAGVQKALLFGIFAILILYVWEWVSEKRAFSNVALLLIMFSLLVIVGMLFLPLFTGQPDAIPFFEKLSNLTGGLLDSTNMTARISGLRKAYYDISASSVMEKLFGIDMGMRYGIGCLYIKILYSVGIVGFLLAMSILIAIFRYAFKVEDRKSYYVTLSLLVLFLGSGVVINSMETVQLSWIPLMFAGMCVSSVQVEKEKKALQPEVQDRFSINDRGYYQVDRAFDICNVVGICPSTKKEFIDIVYSVPRTPLSATIDLVGMPAIVSAKENPQYAQMYNESTMTAIDGMPFVRKARRKGINCERCAAPDIMGPVLQAGLPKGATHFFYGGKNDELLEKLRANLESGYPGINIVGMYSPPFRPLTPEEDKDIIQKINDVHPDFLWVGIGAPKQEMWMSNHRESIKNTCMLGVGAAFDFMAGTLDKAPKWLEEAGLEWLYRLCKEPKRLWKRYIIGGIKYSWWSFISSFQKEK